VFRINQPVTDLAFFDRDKEVERLLALIAELEAGAPSWLAILGPRKIGKTSLILECSRRSTQARVRIAAIDTMVHSPVSTEFFRRYALRVLDALFAPELGESPEAQAQAPGA
jgi:AAA+ ATPase superfamily predicted ATPase